MISAPKHQSEKVKSTASYRPILGRYTWHDVNNEMHGSDICAALVMGLAYSKTAAKLISPVLFLCLCEA